MQNCRIVRTNNLQERVRLYAQADTHTLLGPRQFAAGFIQHPETRLFQIWVSTNGLDLIYVSTRRTMTDAEKDVQAIKGVLSCQAIYDEIELIELFTKLEAESDGHAYPLPDELVRQIGQTITTSLAHRL